MKSYRIITDGSCDMPASLAEEKRVTVVPFYVTMDEKTYIKENVDISKTDFYKWMVENKGSYPKSSTPSVQDYLDVFTEAAEAGEDVICICITRKFSTSFESAQMAADMLAETHPGCRVTVINAMVNTVLQALLVLEAVKLRDKGVDYDECVRRVKATRPTGRIFFTVGSIDYLRHGGRIGKLAGIAGTILGIRQQLGGQGLRDGRRLRLRLRGGGQIPRQDLRRFRLHGPYTKGEHIPHRSGDKRTHRPLSPRCRHNKARLRELNI